MLLKKLFVTLRFSSLSKKWLDRKRRKKNIPAIEYALKRGTYDIRALAAKYLGELRSSVSKHALVSSIDDSVYLVSEAAMCALENIGVDADIQETIQKKRLFWVERKKEPEIKGRSQEKGYMPEKKDRPSRKSFENLKQMLRKPMNSGKWF
ncbi:MAG: hypothetical protein NXI10_16175 [bacterium]|nr:hypothetical protein [bacterium]